MEFKDLVQKRRSNRNFKKGMKVEKDTVLKILEYAKESPSWKNSRTARYHCVIEDSSVEYIREECIPEFNKVNSEGASAYIIATFIKNRSGFDREANPMNELGNAWGVYDLGLHNMNFLLAAKNEGLDTLILGLRDIDKLRKKFQIPEEETIVSLIAIGYSDEELEKPKQKRPDEIVKFY